MTDRLALVFAVLLIALVAADQFLNGGQGALFLARRLTDFIDFLEFWR